MKYYFASSFEAAHKVETMITALSELGHSLTYRWTTNTGARHLPDDKIQEIAIAEKKGVMDAEVVIVMLPGAYGTHCELGMALAAHKPVILMYDPGDGLLSQGDERTCPFYHDPLVQTMAYSRYSLENRPQWTAHVLAVRITERMQLVAAGLRAG